MDSICNVSRGDTFHYQRSKILSKNLLINFKGFMRAGRDESFGPYIGRQVPFDLIYRGVIASLFVMRIIYPLNLLTPNVNYSGRTAPLTSKVVFYIFIQQI